MTMLIRNLAVLMGVAAFLASAQSLRASDVIPLKGTASYDKAQTTTLGSIGDADTELMRGGGGGRGGGGHGGGFHGGGYRGGFYGGYRGGYYGGYRGGYYGGYRGYGYGGYGYGGYGGYYGGYYPYYGGVYYYNPYYYPYYGGYGYVGGYGGGSPQVTVLSQPITYTQPYSSYGAAPGNNFAFGNGNGGGGYNGNGYSNGNGYNGNGYNGMPVAPPSADGTYPYNGGPTMPVPMPVQQQQQFNPAKTAPAVPSTLRLVSTPSQQPQQTSSYAFPAYGEDTRANGYTINRTIPTKQSNR
jgi:hypothetical protein